MPLNRLWKATRLTLAIVGLSVVHSFSGGEWTIVANALAEDRQITADQSDHRLANQLSISQLVATAAAR